MRDARFSLRPLLAGIFVGGGSTRMGGHPKGLLRTSSGDSIVLRLRSLFDSLGVETVLVGAQSAYADTGMEMIADRPSGIGPLGGLAALLERAQDGYAIAVACDMPHVSQALLQKLADHPSVATVVAPRSQHGWEPLFARYRAGTARSVIAEQISERRHSLQALLDAAGAEVIALSEAEWHEVGDWDTPADVTR